MKCLKSAFDWYINVFIYFKRTLCLASGSDRFIYHWEQADVFKFHIFFLIDSRNSSNLYWSAWMNLMNKKRQSKKLNKIKFKSFISTNGAYNLTEKKTIICFFKKKKLLIICFVNLLHICHSIAFDKTIWYLKTVDAPTFFFCHGYEYRKSLLFIAIFLIFRQQKHLVRWFIHVTKHFFFFIRKSSYTRTGWILKRFIDSKINIQKSVKFFQFMKDYTIAQKC